MKSLSRFEYNLMRILQCILQRAPLETVLPAITQPCDPPPCLTRDAVDLIEDTLGKGITLLLARESWRTERFLRGDTAVTGNLWQRTPPENLGLVFSEKSLLLLQWLTATDLNTAKVSTWRTGRNLTVGDRLLFFYAYLVLRDTIPGSVLARTVLFRSDGLCALFFADELAEHRPLTTDWQPWTQPPGSLILETFQGRLAQRWLAMEKTKTAIADKDRMLRLGRAQQAVLQSYLTQLADTQRRDLARFLLDASSRLFATEVDMEAWTGSLRVEKLRIADRLDVYKAALAFLEILKPLRQWAQQARAIGYFDEGYGAAQLWKADWEHFDGETLTEQAEVLLRQAQPV